MVVAPRAHPRTQRDGELLVGKGLVAEVFQQWLHAGKTGPSGLRHYVYALGVQLEDPAVRKKFTERAERLLLHLQSGYVS